MSVGFAPADHAARSAERQEYFAAKQALAQSELQVRQLEQQLADAQAACSGCEQTLAVAGIWQRRAQIDAQLADLPGSSAIDWSGQPITCCPIAPVSMHCTR